MFLISRTKASKLSLDHSTQEDSLPEKPDEIHDLLIELSDEFEIYRGSATLVEEFEIRKKGNLLCMMKP